MRDEIAASQLRGDDASWDPFSDEALCPFVEEAAVALETEGLRWLTGAFRLR